MQLLYRFCSDKLPEEAEFELMGDISELQAKLDKAAKEKEVNGSAAANNTGMMMVRHWSLVGSQNSPLVLMISLHRVI